MTTAESASLLGRTPAISALTERPPVAASVASQQRCNRIKLIFSMAMVAGGAVLFIGSLVSAPFISVSENALQVAGVIVSLALVGFGGAGIFRFGYPGPSIKDLTYTLTVMQNLNLEQFYAKQDNKKDNLFNVSQLEQFQVLTHDVATTMRNLLGRYAVCKQNASNATSIELSQIAANLLPLEAEWEALKNSIFIIEP